MAKARSAPGPHQKKGAAVIEAALGDWARDPKNQALLMEVALSFFEHLKPDELESELQRARKDIGTARVMFRICAAHLQADRALPAPARQFLADMLIRFAERPLGGVLGSPEKDGARPYSDLAIVIIGKEIDRLHAQDSSFLRGNTPCALVADRLRVDVRSVERYYKRYKARDLDKFDV